MWKPWLKSQCTLRLRGTASASRGSGTLVGSRTVAGQGAGLGTVAGQGVGSGTDAG